MLSLLFFSIAFAAEPILISADGKVRPANPAPPPPRYEGPKISIDFQQADIHSVMRFFATVSNKNIVLDDSVTGKVTVRLQNVYWEEAFLAVLWSQGLGAVKMDSVLLVQ